MLNGISASHHPALPHLPPLSGSTYPRNSPFNLVTIFNVKGRCSTGSSKLARAAVRLSSALRLSRSSILQNLAISQLIKQQDPLIFRNPFLAPSTLAPASTSTSTSRGRHTRARCLWRSRGSFKIDEHRNYENPQKIHIPERQGTFLPPSSPLFYPATLTEPSRPPAVGFCASWASLVYPLPPLTTSTFTASLATCRRLIQILPLLSKVGGGRDGTLE